MLLGSEPSGRPDVGRIVVMNHVTLDGVMQAPGRPDEDTRGGFTQGGWGSRSTSAGDAAGKAMGELFSESLNGPPRAFQVASSPS